jgi:hypothetical protein
MEFPPRESREAVPSPALWARLVPGGRKAVAATLKTQRRAVSAQGRGILAAQPPKHLRPGMVWALLAAPNRDTTGP